MSKLTSPSITITFTELGVSAITRGERGVAAVVLKDTAASVTTLLSAKDIPAALSKLNQQLLLDALKGYTNAPKKVIAYVMASEKDMAASYKAAETYFETEEADYIAWPYAETDGKGEEIASWVKGIRTNDHSKTKAVLSNQAADCDGVINWTTALKRAVSTTADDGTITTALVDVPPEQGTARIAGLLAGTGIAYSATYAPLTDFVDCTRLTKEARNTAVGEGKLLAFWDGGKVKLDRAVNSFVTTVQGKGDSFKKIKIVEAMDLMQHDIRETIENDYIGKFANTYDNKLLLVTAIGAYFDTLIDDDVLSAREVSIDVEAQRTYLKSIGKPAVIPNAAGATEKAVDDCTDDEIKRANTGSHVFLKAVVSILDAIEDVELDISI